VVRKGSEHWLPIVPIIAIVRECDNRIAKFTIVHASELSANQKRFDVTQNVDIRNWIIVNIYQEDCNQGCI
jgi:hypothetical protein